MRWSVAFGPLFAALALAGCGGTKTVTRTVTVTATSTSEAQDVQQAPFYGHIESLRRDGDRFVLRFDPALLLTGTAAERAAVEDKVLEPGQPVPNDNYTFEEGDRLLTFDVSPEADVKMLGKSLRPTKMSVAELADTLAGRKPTHPLFDPSNHSGFWIRIGTKYPNAVVALEQQYHP